MPAPHLWRRVRVQIRFPHAAPNQGHAGQGLDAAYRPHPDPTLTPRPASLPDRPPPTLFLPLPQSAPCASQIQPALERHTGGLCQLCARNAGMRVLHGAYFVARVQLCAVRVRGCPQLGVVVDSSVKVSLPPPRLLCANVLLHRSSFKCSASSVGHVSSSL